MNFQHHPSAIVGTTGERAATLCEQLSRRTSRCTFFRSMFRRFSGPCFWPCRQFLYDFRKEESIKSSVENAPKCSAWAKSTVLLLGVSLIDLEGSLTCISHRDGRALLLNTL